MFWEIGYNQTKPSKTRKASVEEVSITPWKPVVPIENLLPAWELSRVLPPWPGITEQGPRRQRGAEAPWELALCLNLLCSSPHSLLLSQTRCSINVGRRKRKIQICPQSPRTNDRERRFPQNHRLLSYTEATWPPRLRPQQQGSNQEGELLEPRWRSNGWGREAAPTHS